MKNTDRYNGFLKTPILWKDCLAEIYQFQAVSKEKEINELNISEKLRLGNYV